VVDVTNKENPKKIGSVSDWKGYAVGVILSSDGKTLFVANDDQGLWVIDVTNTKSPTKIGSVPN
jgi:hypothetical protein